MMILFSSLTFAEDYYELNGTFAPNGQQEVLISKRNEPVYGFTRSGKDRLQVLKADGYTCKLLPRQTYLCSKFDKTLNVSASVQKRADSYFSTGTVRFEDRRVIPVKITEGESLVVYRFNKMVFFQGKSYDYFDYQVSRSGLHKVKFGEGISREEYLVNHEGLISKVRLFSDQEKKYYDQFLIEAEFPQSR